MSEYRGQYNSTDFTGDFIDVAEIRTESLALTADVDQISLGTDGVTVISDVATVNRTITIPDTLGENCQFVLSGNVNQIIEGDNTFTGQNTFEDDTTFETLIKVDTIEEFNINYGVSVEGVTFKYGTIYGSSYLTGVLHSSNLGNVTSSLIVNNDITANTIAYDKLNQLATGKLLGNISGITSNISPIDTTYNATANTIPLRNGSGNIAYKNVYANSLGSLDQPYTYVKNIKFEDNIVSCISSSDFYLFNDTAGVFQIKNNVGELYLSSETDNINIISYGYGKIIQCWNDLHALSSVFTDNINEEVIGNGVYIDGVHCKDGGITISGLTLSGFTTGIIHSTLGVLSSSLIVNADVSASAAIAYSKLNLSNSILNADINTAAAIAYSKLNLSGSIVNTDISASAAIAYSKLSLTNSIRNADILTTAAIAYSKLSLTNSILNADINTAAAIAYSKLNLTGNIINTDISASAAIAYSKLNLTNSIRNADILTTAAIAYSKLSLTNSIINGDLTSLCVATGNIQNLAVTTAKIANNTVTYAKMQQISTNNRLLGYIGTGAPANVAEIAADTAATGSTIVLRGAFGEITGGAGTFDGLNLTGQCIQVGNFNQQRHNNPSADGITMTYIYGRGSSELAPSPVLSGDNLASSIYRGQNNTSPYSTSPAAQFDIQCIENFSPTANGTRFIFKTCAPLSNVLNDRVFIDSTGLSLQNSGVIVTTSGTSSLPSLTFTGDTDTGIYADAANVISFTTTGARRARITDGGIQLSSGTVANPSYNFIADTNTGMYHAGTDNIGFAANGVKQVDITTSGISATGYSADGLTYLTGILATGTLTNMTLGDVNFNFNAVTNAATWTRLFNTVTIFFSIFWNGKGSTNSALPIRIKGLPYASNATYGGNSITASIAGNPGITFAGANQYLTMSCVAGQTYTTMWIQNSAGGDTNVTCGNMGTAGSMYITLTYSV